LPRLGLDGDDLGSRRGHQAFAIDKAAGQKCGQDNDREHQSQPDDPFAFVAGGFGGVIRPARPKRQQQKRHRKTEDQACANQQHPPRGGDCGGRWPCGVDD